MWRFSAARQHEHRGAHSRSLGGGMISAVNFRDPKEFSNRITSRIGAEEVRYNLILGVSRRLLHDLHEYGQEDPWFLVLEEDGELLALALRTPPFEILVAAFTGDPVEIPRRLAAEASCAFDALPGVVGEPDIADRVF